MDRTQVRAVRERLELTQEEAGKRIGVSRQAWQKWESGERDCVGAADRLIYLMDISPWVREQLRQME